MIECQVMQGCEVGITVRHNGNVDILRLCFASVFLVTSNLSEPSLLGRA